MLDNLGEAFPKFPSGQGKQGVGIGEDEPGLVKSSNEVFSFGCVDTGFSSHGGVDLRDNRSGDLDEWYSTIKNRGNKSSEITGYSAAKSNYKGRSVVPCLNQFAVQILNYGHRFGGLTRGENVRGESVSHLQERAFKLFEEMWCDIIVSDNRSHPGESGGLDVRAGFGK
jgi:hypothetical protein